VIEPDRDVRGFQSVLLDLGARLKLPGFITENGDPKFEDYADYIINHERRPGVGPLAGFRGKNGDKEGRGETNPKQIQAYIENGGFWKKHIPEAAQFFKPWNVEYQEWAVETGLFDKQSPYLFDIYIEPMQKFILSAKGIGEMQPPDHLRKQIIDTMDPLPIWYQPFEEQVTDGEEFPVHALTQRPMAMYHSWGSQNAWLRQIHGYNPMYLPKKIWKEKNFQEGDWALVTSRSGSIKVPVSRMDALNENTIWTWNAIGKRRGAWGLSENATESNKGFLLNHIIHELLPPKKDGMRWSNSDPITGQAAWFDLKVKVEKISKEEHVTPFAHPQKSPVKSDVNDVKYGEDFID
jgi:anaerobic selenocysteine-containing dehydrogenase